MNNIVNVTYYKNRKLYSKDAKRYINLEECKKVIDAGYSIKFTDYESGADVTDRCLKEMLIKCNDIKASDILKLIQRGE